MSSTHTEKAALRARILAARDALSPEARRTASARIAEQLLALPSFHAAQTVLLFYPFGSEWDARLMIAAALQQRKTLVLPRVVRATRQLALHRVDDPESGLVTGVWGIREPQADCQTLSPQQLDWILAPGLAFTRAGDRMGYGAGYFDRLLAEVPATTPVIAGAFAVQIVPELPVEAHDRKVSLVVVG